MTNSKDWNKKAALFASGLVCALCFRIPISIASFCVTRFNLDPSYFSIFTSRMVNAMLMAQLFGNWFGVLFTALDGKVKLIVLAVSSWLCLISFMFALFFFCHSEKGHLTGYYWSVVVVNFFAKVSDAVCLVISLDCTNWYVSTYSISTAYTSLTKSLLLMLINGNGGTNTVDNVTGVRARSVKTTIDYRVCMLMFIITIILMLLISALWTTVSIIATNGKLESSNIKWLKYLTGVSTGCILSMPGALLGAGVGSMFEKYSTHCFKNTAFVKAVESRQIIFCFIGSAVVFVAAIGAIKHVPNEKEQWVPSSNLGFNLDVAKYAGARFGPGVLLGLCFGAIAYRFKANICRSMVLCLIAGSLLGSALGILIYERLSSFVMLNVNPTSDATINNHDHSKLVESELVEENASNSSGETLEELLKKNVDVKDLPSLDIIRGWANCTVYGEYTGVDHNNNKWARALQNVGTVDVSRTGEWLLSQARVESSDVTKWGNNIKVQITFSGESVLGQTMDLTEEERIINVIQREIDKTIGKDRVIVTSVTGNGTDSKQMVFDVMGRVMILSLAESEQQSIMNTVRTTLKNEEVTYSKITQCNLSNGTVDMGIGVSSVALREIGDNNKITIEVGGVSGVIEGDKLLKRGKDQIKNAVKELFDRELGSDAVKLENVETCVHHDKINITVTMSNTENTWARSLRKLNRVHFSSEKYWDLTEATVAVGGVKQDMPNRFTITVNLPGAKEYQSASDDGKEKLKETLQKIFDNAYGDGVVTAEQLTAHVNAENTITIVFNLKKKENVWTKSIQNIDFVNVNNRGEWHLSQAGALKSDLLKMGGHITIKTTLSGAGVLGQTMDLTEQERLKLALQKEFNSLIPGYVTVTSVTGMTKYIGQIVFTTEGEGRRLTLSAQENSIIRKALDNVFRNGKVKYSTNSYWNFKNAKVDLTSRGVTTDGNTIKITVTDVIGATNGDTFEKLHHDKIKHSLQDAIDKKIGKDRVIVTSVTGKGTDSSKIQLTVSVKAANVERKKFAATYVNRTAGDVLSLQKPEVMGGWVSSVIMNVLGLGTVYAVYPGMAPCSITEFSHFNRINNVIQTVSVISPIIIIYVSETSGGPEKKWDGERKWWYIGLLFTMVQNICMIIVVLVVHQHNSKLSKMVKSSPVIGGALTILMVLCQVTSTSIGYAGAVANSGFTLMSFNNTATLTTMVFMSLLGEGYLTELKKYEPGIWPTQGMGDYIAFKWWCGKGFANAWEILKCIYTKDLRRDMNMFATNNKHSSAIIFVL